MHAFLGDAGELKPGLALGAGIALLNGGIFGSGEYMAAVLAEPENKRSIAYFDEMSECFEKDKHQGSIIEKKLLQLFEGNAIAQGSFKNRTHAAVGIEFSFVGGFTDPSLRESLTGRGSAGSGFLSRCIFSYADRVPHVRDWDEIDRDRAMELRGKIASCLGVLPLHSGSAAQRYIVEETPDATRLRREAIAWIETFDDRYRARLADHLKRDLILRAVFSPSPKPVINPEMVQRSKLWVQNQYENRVLLWPEDAGTPIERMEHIILRTLDKAKAPVSDNTLALNCNAHRANSGGFKAFGAAIIALIHTGQIKAVGKTRKGRLVYERI